MSNLQTDNDEYGFALKIKLRLEAVESHPSSEVKVLDCYSGHGLIWAAVARMTSKQLLVTAIDKRPDKSGVFLKGDNLKFIKSMDLSLIDCIDLDAYGQPITQLREVFKQGFRGFVFVTFIQTGMGKMNLSMLQDLGITKAMYRRCPTIFSLNSDKYLHNWLRMNGVERIKCLNLSRKRYFYFSQENYERDRNHLD